ncbi:hypothetical protein PV325_004693 [Microctonus aethiopoides]|uniref:Uncharacterized protein n=1 Tax=Microctonus aethiopoides TaxID=144406 RepID=A0AA39C6I3_9HYME|nr:hypothetical protein PV325_004693 [Microctonus aethiopoides]KAK0158390.1 hypothetical protein PV328_009397 [Microctonus aethiopoides]
MLGGSKFNGWSLKLNTIDFHCDEEYIVVVVVKHSGYYPEGKDLFAAKAAVTGHCPDIVETTTASSSPLTLGVIGRYVGVTGRGYRRGVQKLLKTQDTDQQRV